MKNLIGFLILMCPGWVQAQDIIIFKNKEELSARVVHEDREFIEYLEGHGNKRTLKRIPSKEVKKVRYQKIDGKVNAIQVVHDSLSNEYFLNDVINHIIVTGYTIDKFDNNYYTVSTQYVNNDRITVRIKDRVAVFRSFQKEDEEEVYPHARATVTWDVKPEPGEKKGFPGTTAFDKMDDLCRTYLKNGHAVMHYQVE